MQILRPDDWHLHLRDGLLLAAVLPATAADFGRALVMPNLKPPVRNLADALAYRDRILSLLPDDTTFDPLMTLYLTDSTTPEQIRTAAASPHVLAAKLYPAGATTNSDSGVTDIDALDPVLEAMAESGMVLCVHGEVTHDEVDVFDREARFLDGVLAPLMVRHPTLRIVIEHATTREAVQLAATEDRIAASITAHHLLWDRNALFEGGIRPHRYCLPVLKRRHHRDALVAAATSGDASYFLGTDSAPHLRSTKETSCGCAGMYTAPVALPIVAQVFEQAGALDQLEAFTSLNGARFYGVPEPTTRIELVRQPFVVPTSVPGIDEDDLHPCCAGETLAWRVG